MACRLDTDEGGAALADLFLGRSQRLVCRLTFGLAWKAGRPSCSMIANGSHGFAVHPAQLDVMLRAISWAPLEKLPAFKKRTGWSFPRTSLPRPAWLIGSVVPPRRLARASSQAAPPSQNYVD